MPNRTIDISAIDGVTRALFEEAGDGLFLFDPETDELLAVNPMAEKMSGLTAGELCRMPATYWFRFGGQGGMQQLRQAAAKSGVFHSQEGYVLRTRDDGVWVPVNLTVSRLHVKPKTLALITARDVRTQREAHVQLEAVETELRRVLASVSDCLWSAEIDAAGRWKYRYFSPVVERITGHPPSYFLDGTEHWGGIVHPEDRPRWEQALVRLRSGRSGHEEYRVIRPDGTVHWVRDTVLVRPASAGESSGTGLRL
ncbi:MAG TPA: PAS domain-containing protein, partial [Gemmataceae bacterium]|nr:PAS domain-containing protein [Gemmataceae bacterium]